MEYLLFSSELVGINSVVTVMLKYPGQGAKDALYIPPAAKDSHFKVLLLKSK